MANILISHFSPIQDAGRFTPMCFFDALSKGFQECGHHVKHMISSRFIPRAWNGDNGIHADIDRARLFQDIQHFAPDLCIFANNSVPDVAYEATNCPVILLLSDTVAFFNDKEHIRRRAYGDRIHFYAPFKRDLHEIKQYFGEESGRIIHLLPATGVVAQNLPVNHNISFIGSNFQNGANLGKLLRNFPERHRIQEILSIFQKDTSSLDFLTEAERQLIAEHVPLSDFPFIFSARDRMLTLALLAEEGLGLYGGNNWHETAQYFPDVAAAFDPRPVYSLAHNQTIYNASKLCLSISHSQAQDGFPWRVMDIMASSGCLLSDRKQGLSDFTRGYVDLPMYDTPVQARELAQRLLKDDAWRSDLVARSQACIEEKGRWKHRFRDLQEQVGVPLVLPDAPPGTVSYMQGEDYVVPTPPPDLPSRPRWRQALSDAARSLRGR